MSDENRKLAEWMGWRQERVESDPFSYGWFKHGGLIVQAKDWHPRTSIEQAMMLLDRFLSWEIRRYSKHDYRCRINDETLIEGPMQDTPEAAIVEAVMRVIEEGGDAK